MHQLIDVNGGMNDSFDVKIIIKCFVICVDIEIEPSLLWFYQLHMISRE